MLRRPKATKTGTVEKIVKRHGESEKAQINVHEADHLYKELRIENTLEIAKGKKVKLKKGAVVDVTVTANQADTEPKTDEES